MRRIVALGDSLTEGVGDPHPLHPNGLRGWADLLAAHLALADEQTEYVNLALRAKRLRHVLAEQVPVARRLQPDLLTLWAGGNDVLRPGVRLRDLEEQLDRCVAELVATGAEVLVFTGYELSGSPLLRGARGRIALLNDRIAQVSRSHGACVVDVSRFAEWSARPMLGPDRVHPSAHGHRHLARHVADLLGAAPLPMEDEHWRAPGERAPSSRVGALREELLWWRANVLPQVRRWATNASAREGNLPKWPVPVRPATWTAGGDPSAHRGPLATVGRPTGA